MSRLRADGETDSVVYVHRYDLHRSHAINDPPPQKKSALMHGNTSTAARACWGYGAGTCWLCIRFIWW